MPELIVGLDEIATETQLSEGWSYLVLPKLQFPKFTVEADKIGSSLSKRVFHGKKFKKQETNEYHRFLLLIRQVAENNLSSLLVFTLMNESWKSKYLPFVGRIVKNSMAQANVLSADAEEQVSKLMPGLLDLQKRLSGLSGSTSVEIELDRDDVTRKFSQTVAIYKPESLSLDVKAETILRAIYNGIGKKQFPNSPALSNNGFRVVSDAKSRLIQAADVFGNFAMAYLLVKLGDKSNKREAKAEIFDKVFGDLLTDDLSKSAKLSSNGEVELLSNGALTLEIS